MSVSPKKRKPGNKVESKAIKKRAAWTKKGGRKRWVRQLMSEEKYMMVVIRKRKDVKGRWRQRMDD
jgi:hypothetical protein